MIFNKKFFLIFSLIFALSIVFQVKAIATAPMSKDSSTESSSNREIVVNDTKNDTQITIEQGDILIVKLLANPGTGYSWQIVKNDRDRLQPLTDSASTLEAEVPGASEFQVFRFAAQNLGASILELHYLRAWEKNIPPLKTYRINIEIR